MEYLAVILPIVLVPLVMRFIISPLIFLHLKKKYVKEITQNLGKSWCDPKDLEAIEFLTDFAWKDLSRPFVLSYNSRNLKAQFNSLLIGISEIYTNSPREISMEFSAQKLMEALYLLFEELHRDLSRLKLFSIVEKLPLNLILRASKINKSLRIFTRNRILKRLNKYRLTIKILRFILIPIFGLPIILTQLIFSLLYSTVFEGYLRFIYGLILLKVGYYGIYLYSNRSSSLYTLADFDKSKIIVRAKTIEERHTKFKSRFRYTKNLEKALIYLKEELEKLNIPVDSEMDDRVFLKLSLKAFNTVKEVISSEFTDEKKNRISLTPLLDIFNSIAAIYYPNSGTPLYNIRTKEALEFGYFFTTLSLKNIYTIPGFSKLLDKIPLKLILDLGEILSSRKVKEALPYIKKGKRILTNVQNYYFTTRALLKRGNPAILAATMVTPIIYHHSLISIKEYIYNISSLLLIDSLESSALKSNQSRIEKTSLKK